MYVYLYVCMCACMAYIARNITSWGCHWVSLQLYLNVSVSKYISSSRHICISLSDKIWLKFILIIFFFLNFFSEIVQFKVRHNSAHKHVGKMSKLSIWTSYKQNKHESLQRIRTVPIKTTKKSILLVYNTRTKYWSCNYLSLTPIKDKKQSENNQIYI